ncbi:MAG: oxidoreductase [Chthonomonadaceae bacterium]|nr:oxidoreductase [Chthonomonadaceae bacterium]
MQALNLGRYGGPEVLCIEEVEDPRPAPGEVLVELRCAALNHRDLFVREGAYPLPLPLIPGSDGAGVRRDTGEPVVILPSVAWGEDDTAPGPAFRILGGADPGTHAELLSVPAENIFPKPRNLSWQESAALPLAGLTAHRALFRRGRLRPGETVLVQGVGGGVATIAIALAVASGARVLATSSAPAKLEAARQVGAEGGVLYTDDDWPAQICQLTGGQGVDLVLDSGGATWETSVSCLRPGGRAVVFGATVGPRPSLDARPFFYGQFDLLGTTMGSPSDFAALLDLVERENIHPVIDSVWPLDDLASAHRRLESGKQCGKVVVDIGGG